MRDALSPEWRFSSQAHSLDSPPVSLAAGVSTVGTRSRAEAAPAVVMRTRTRGPVTPPAPAAAAAKASAARKPRAAGSTAKPAAAAPSRARKSSADAGSPPSVSAGRPTSSSRARASRPAGGRGAGAKASSYYRVVGGVRYDRKVLEDCEASVNDDGVIDLNDARRVVADVLDGPRREQGRGVKSAVTDCELATLRYAQSRFEWTEEAKAWVFGPRGVVASVDAGNDAPLDETRNAKREDDAGVGVVENAEDDEDDDVEDDEEDDVEDDEDDDMEDSSDSDTSSDTSSSDSDSDSSPLQKQTWSTLDAPTALAFARCAELAAAKAAAAEAEATGTLFQMSGGVSERKEKENDGIDSRESFLRRERRAAAAFAARDAAAAAGDFFDSQRFGVRSSSLGDARDSLFGGHAIGGNLEEVIPAFSASRGERVDALPSRRAAEARKKPKQILLERDARRRGKDGAKKALRQKSDAMVSARALAEEGAGLFVKPLDTSKLRRDAKRLGGGDGGNAAKSWFSMPAVEYTPELRRDMRLLKLRGAYDPKRFYKTDDTTKLPKNFQIGTVVEGAQDFYSARLTKKERKRTLTEEVFADAEIKAVRKKRFAKIQAAKAHTMGRKEKRKLGGRTRGAGGKSPGNAQKSTKRIKR